MLLLKAKEIPPVEGKKGAKAASPVPLPEEATTIAKWPPLHVLPCLQMEESLHLPIWSAMARLPRPRKGRGKSINLYAPGRMMEKDPEAMMSQKSSQRHWVARRMLQARHMRLQRGGRL